MKYLCILSEIFAIFQELKKMKEDRSDDPYKISPTEASRKVISPSNLIDFVPKVRIFIQ